MSETQTVTIADFLLARIAEDEAAAREAMAYEGGDEQVAALPEPIFRHVVSNGPQRVLAECEAKRRIVEDFMVYAADYRDAPSDFAAGRRHAALLAMTRLVEPFADHPDYRQEWKP